MNARIARVPLRLGLAALILVLAACSTAVQSRKPSDTDVPATYEAVECPTDVRIHPDAGGLDMTCGYLTVPERRSGMSDRTIRLFVTRTSPSQATSAEPLLLLAGELGWSGFYGVEAGWGPIDPGYSLLPDEVHREVINLDLRGVGRSEPNLFCGEVEALRLDNPGTSAGDPAFLSDLTDAVAACRERLVGDGIELGAYEVAEMAADVDDLRAALGVDSWNVQTLGSASRVAIELLRRFPEHIRAVVLDSPAPPATDTATNWIVGMRSALAKLYEACDADPECLRAYPDLEGTLGRLLASMTEEPGRVNDRGHRFTIDGAAILRLVRDGLPEDEPTPIVMQIHRAAREGVDWLAEVFDGDPVLAKGYTPAGLDAPNLVYGAYYSTLCRDELAFADFDALAELAAGEPWYTTAYIDSPYRAICEIWDVGRAEADPHRPVASDVPTLVVTGRFDPYAPTEQIAADTQGLASSWIVERSYLGHLVLSEDGCMRDVRSFWLDHPHAAPGDCPSDPLRFVID
jgi:pimeloyl-ACP methyl ester carboxylesterase